MLKRFYTAMIEGRKQSAMRRIAEMELGRLTDRELHDIGIGRSEIPRIIREM